ncbi:Triose-phosphate Transporter [Entomortierella chlamydospora]|uniref:Triose-phosphate Transporter n=1 Tax=Entomortierella chlamydospora TaxID=101097 RepID=A0A9P6T076_9FUNG|nr:Triose-phosphate Transporter [Entomortierella chlamydospora]
MTSSSRGLMSAEKGDGGGIRDSFDDESPFLDAHRTFEDEQESFIDATSDSYNAPPPATKNPFDDNGRTHSQQQQHYHKAKNDAAYDSFDSHDDDDDDDELDSADSGSEYTGEEDEGYRAPSDEDDDQEEDEGEEDTQRLLLSSNNARMGGMGMGMRAGETGTGTMLGLDLEQRGNQQDDDYDTLPLSTIDVERIRMKERGHGKGVKDSSTKRRKGHKGTKSRRRRSRESTGSQPVLGLGAIRSEQMAAIAKKQLRVQMAWNAFYVFAWYSCSSALSFYNKWLFSPNHHNFQFPLFTSSFHMVAQFLLSSLTLAIMPYLRPKAAPSAKDFGTKIMPCAVASGLDIGLSNSSLKTITLAFYTMCKSSSLAFVLLFAFAFKLERPTWTLAGVIAVICVGLFMMVMSEVDFVLIGFIQVMLASVLGGLRWALTQILLEKSDTKSGSLNNPISTIFFLSPIMGVCLGIVSGIFEGFGTIFTSPFFETAAKGLSTMGLVFLGGLFAFLMVLAEFNLITRTSVVSLSVMGIVKEVATILVSSVVFHDHLTLVNILGLFITLTGIGFYHFMKLREIMAKSRRDAKELADAQQEKAAKKKERASARKSRGKQSDGGGGGGGEESSGSGGSGGAGSNSRMLEYKDSDRDASILEEEPWNVSLAPPNAKGARKDSLQDDEEVFILDDDDEVGHASK